MLYVLLFIKELGEKCFIPAHQFDFQHGIGCADALAVVANTPLDASCTGSSVALASHDVRHTFDSLIHPLMLLRAVKREVNPAIIRSEKGVYAKLGFRLKTPLKQDEKARPLDRTIPVKTGARQGAIASPCYFNNYVLKAQDQCEMSCILSDLNIALVSYADDMFILPELWTKYLKLSKSASRIFNICFWI